MQSDICRYNGNDEWVSLLGLGELYLQGNEEGGGSDPHMQWVILVQALSLMYFPLFCTLV